MTAPEIAPILQRMDKLSDEKSIEGLDKLGDDLDMLQSRLDARLLLLKPLDPPAVPKLSHARQRLFCRAIQIQAEGVLPEIIESFRRILGTMELQRFENFQLAELFAGPRGTLEVDWGDALSFWRIDASRIGWPGVHVRVYGGEKGSVRSFRLVSTLMRHLREVS